LGEINLGVDPQATDNAGDGVPGHFDDVSAGDSLFTFGLG
jgi:hypothetical protein